MLIVFNQTGYALRLALVGAALATIGFAQMNGRGGSGMMGPVSTGGGISSIGFGMQGGMLGIGAAMDSMAPGPVVGSDGTAYVLRQTAVTSGSQQTIQNELVAISPSSGKVNWALAIAGTMISGPVLGKDGTILLTISEPHQFVSSSTSAQSALVIVAPSATSARVQARVVIDSYLLSTPVMSPDGQTIYVIATEMPGMVAGSQTISAGSRWLYAFGPGTGSFKFKVQLR